MVRRQLVRVQVAARRTQMLVEAVVRHRLTLAVEEARHRRREEVEVQPQILAAAVVEVLASPQYALHTRMWFSLLWY